MPLMAAVGGMALVAMSLALVIAVTRSSHRIEVTLDQDDVQRAVAGVCPVTGRYRGLTTYSFSQPSIAFDLVMKRIVIRLQLDLSIAGHALTGRAVCRGTLRFDAVRRCVLLDRVDIDEIPIAGLAAGLAAHLQEPLRLALFEQLEALVLCQVHLDRAADDSEVPWTIRAITLRERGMTAVLGR